MVVHSNSLNMFSIGFAALVICFKTRDTSVGNGKKTQHHPLWLLLPNPSTWNLFRFLSVKSGCTFASTRSEPLIITHLPSTWIQVKWTHPTDVPTRSRVCVFHFGSVAARSASLGRFWFWSRHGDVTRCRVVCWSRGVMCRAVSTGIIMCAYVILSMEAT